MEDFSIPLIQEDAPSVSPKRASEEAFYAAYTKGGPDALANYDTARADLEQTGTSVFVNTEKAAWNQEQNTAKKETIANIMGDSTISDSIKKAVLQGYSLTDNVPATLKEKYIQKVAIKPTHKTIDDRESQDKNVELLGERVIENKKTSTISNIVEGSLGLTKILSEVMVRSTLRMNSKATSEATASIAASLLMSIPAGFAGLFQTIRTQDSAKGAELISKIQAYAYQPKDKQSQLIQMAILEAAESLSIPAKEIGSFVNKYSNIAAEQYAETMYPESVARSKARGQEQDSVEGAAGLATIAEIALDPLNWLGVLGVKSLTSAAPGIHGITFAPKVAVDSALELANVANPMEATRMAMVAIEEPTGKIAGALGADKGEIIHDWVLPKIVSDDVANAHPDLTTKIVAKVKAQDDKIRASFVHFRYDPNLINATTREAEVDAILQITRESRAPHYNQAMSLINETDSLFEGNAVFGRNDSNGYTRVKDAQKALANLKESIDLLPEDQRGIAAIVKYEGQHYINWQWKKEYSELGQLVFSKDSIQTSVLGVDVSALARSSTGRWLFPTGRFPKWLENSSLRGVERGGKLKADLTKTISDNISDSKYKPELDYLIKEAEETGVDYFSPEAIGSMFPKISKKGIEELFTTHTFWNRQQQYNHNFLNRETRHNLVNGNMQGLYAKDGTYIGAATSKVSPKELADISEIWDFDKKMPVKYTPEMERQVVRLNDSVKGEDAVHEYGLIGADANLNLLPQEVLKRIPGYSGRKVDLSWYIDIKPLSLMVNGKKVSDEAALNRFVQTKAAAKTEHEGGKIAEELRERFPNSTVTVRPERTDNFGRVMTDYSIHQEFLKHSMKRGERLPSLNGPARLEDRMVTLMNTTSAISRMGSTRTWSDTFQASFVRGFSKFTRGEFPQYASDIKPLENMGRVDQQAYNTAQALFKHYERIKNTETAGDFYYTAGLHNIADVLEKWKIPSSVLRGKHENPLMLAKTVATVSYIHLTPLRQWMMQPIQQLEMYAINPQTAVKNFSNTLAIRMYLGAESRVLNVHKDTLQANARRTGELAGNKEFLDDVNAIRSSGVLQSVDLNSIVHGTFREVDRHLKENVPERIWSDIETLAKAIPRASRAVGFDAAELTNRVGNWLQVKDLWKAKNPDKNWKSKEALEEIAAEALKLSGAMNRAGQLPYQEGVLSIGFQFAAINQKLLMNLIQDNTTILNASQRARLAAVRFALFGGKYGIPGGAVAYHFIEQSEDEDVKKYAEDIKRGAIDYAANGLIAALVEPDEKSDLAMSKMLSPYSEGFLPYFAFGWETLKLVDDKPAGPKYPAIGMIGSFGQAAEDIGGWWTTREVNETNYKQMFMEAGETASGFNSYAQGVLMLGMRDKVTKMGNKYGMEFHASEAYAKMTFGITTQKEEDLWKIVQLSSDMKKEKANMAKVIHRQISNQINKRGLEGEEAYSEKMRMTNSFINLLESPEFSQADKMDVITEIAKIDEKNYKTISQSILVDNWKYHREKVTQKRMQINDILQRSPDPTVQKYLKALKEGNL